MSMKVRPFRGGWEVDIHYRLADGTRMRERRVAPVSSRTSATRWGETLAKQILLRDGIQVMDAPPTLAEFAPPFLTEYCVGERQKASGIQRKEIALRVHLVPLLGKKRLDEITTEDVARVKVRLRGQSASSVNNVLTVLSKLLKVAVEWRVIDAVPCTVRLLPRARGEAAFWDFEELDRLEAAAESVGPTALLVVLLGALAGLRLGELVALQWTDVDLARSRLTVRRNDWRGHIDTPKGGRSGVVDLCDRLADALAAHQVHSRLLAQDDRVLCRPDGRPLTERIVRRHMEAAERLAGLPHRGVHALRHSFGAALAMRGASPKAIQELMRHADLSMTQRYTHLSPAARETAVRLLDQPTPSRLTSSAPTPPTSS
jgi:integrase